MRALSLFLILAITGNALAGVVLEVQQISGCCNACNSCGCEHVNQYGGEDTETTTEEPETTTEEPETTTEAQDPRCPDGYKYCEDNDRCYYCSDDTAKWEEARDNCTGLGGYLAQITSDEELDCIVELMGTTVQKWIGLNDRDNEGINVWVNDDSVNTYSRYLPGTSNNGNNQDCFILHAPSAFAGFEDRPCQNPKHYLCEADSIQPIVG